MRNLNQRLDICSINTATLGHNQPIVKTIDAVARAGFGYIAPWRKEVEAANIHEVARQLRALNLKLSGYVRSTFFTSGSPAQFASSIEDNKKALDQAAELGAPSLIVVGGGLPSGSRSLADARKLYVEGTAQLWDYAKTVGVGITLEPLHPMYAAERSCVVTLDDALDICHEIDPDQTGSLGVAIDVYHCWWDRHLSSHIERAGRERRINAFHVSDWLTPTQDMLLDRGMMGDGVIDLKGIREQVEAVGYVGAVEVEIFSENDWWQRDAQETLRICAERLQTVC
ncbi:MAG: sugar phosphate isomerase/epimerase family protein [Polaromonas sp.]|uniref:sugar phosphate isomerase/epimerase family protein n=1 Tax=Polaromonas sp. TaxID=1869339 RepID=UPI0027334986|nr:sugar phosphate isomerase/epimerase family protein [Polaromonas sp.]MDP3795764.1 sugar phosphate isomerase/epimerase family protein [Polaromonas sp.]